jgi:regulator of sigma E protease
MMSVLINILAILVALGVLVSVHEYGHFIVARWCGVKVLRFSIGFGRPLWRRVSKQGTEFTLAWIPLGGYVRMLDEREGPVPGEQRQQAFNNKGVWQRIAVVSAGPLANFIFAIFAYWLVFMLTATQLVPVIGSVGAGSLAAQAGLKANQEIVAVDQQKVDSWQAINLALVRRLGDSGPLTISIKQPDSGGRVTKTIDLDHWLAGADNPEALDSLGISPLLPVLPAVIGQLSAGQPAAQAGLQPGDKVIKVNQQTVTDWSDFVSIIQSHPDKQLTLVVERQQQPVTLTLTPTAKKLADGQVIGHIGAGVQSAKQLDNLFRTYHYTPWSALLRAMQQTVDMIVINLVAIKKLLLGLISISNISGPVTIAQVAGQTAASGLVAFLSFLAFLSVALGVLNLLPVPVLDGGHLLYYLIEVVIRRPVPENIQAVGFKLGLLVIIGLMVLALFNDLTRLGLGH